VLSFGWPGALPGVVWVSTRAPREAFAATCGSSIAAADLVNRGF